jgi:hypothetical protein
MTPQEQRAEADFCEKVQHGVEDGFAVWGDVVSAFAEPPGDRVEEPEEESEDAAGVEGAFDFWACGSRGEWVI